MSCKSCKLYFRTSFPSTNTSPEFTSYSRGIRLINVDLPDGLDAVVEQGGDNFSGGQKQRLSIARAIIKPASIYVFDDSFSALDFKTDAKLRLALRQDERISKAIIVIVAQRISTVTGADHIVVLDEGKVVGQGTHKELLADNTTYQEIVESQMKGAAI